MILISVEFDNPPRGMMAAFKESRKEAMHAVGWHWYTHFLPRHFEYGAYSRYNYATRTVPYEKRKARVMRHRNPLVFTGTLRKTVKSSARIEATHKQATVVLQGPRWLKGYIAFKGRTGTGPDKAAEMTRVTDAEMKHLANVAEAVWALRLKDAV